MNLDYFTPSYMYSFGDPLLSFGFLLLCKACYVKHPQFDCAADYFISPLFTPDELLRRYPPTRMLVGTADPLHDDAVRLALRLQ